jgi:2-dehydro-3-deoxygalactonokinase
MAGPDWIAVDWGTSRLRAWGLGPDGRTLFAAEAEQGMARLAPADYPGVLTALLAPHLPPEVAPLDVVICGMAGARQGWMEARYLPVPADLNALARHAVTPPMPGSALRPRILPGLCQSRAGAEDVMRGEETQLLGVAALQDGFDGVVALPGTHCKWVRLAGRQARDFHSAMTGELYELLRLQSVLRHSLDAAAVDPEARAAGLAEGLAEGLAAPGELLGRLFRVRAAALLAGRPPAWCDGLLSGLLVGSDIGARLPQLRDQPVVLVGAPALVSIYAEGLAQAGLAAQGIDATTAALAGLTAARAPAT